MTKDLFINLDLREYLITQGFLATDCPSPENTQITFNITEYLESQNLIVINKKLAEKLEQDFYLHEYESYEHYREVQVFHNKRKLNQVWADSKTLDLIVARLHQEFPGVKLKGICHGARNGFEQNYLAENHGISVIGTDISETALNFPRSVHWDFHDENADWIGSHDFIYTNSLDQSWKPRQACTTWLNQLKKGGMLMIEHTIVHSPAGAGEMDPFGAKPVYMPYLLSEWFGHFISIELIKSVKCNMDLSVLILVVKKLIAGKLPS
jgi:hypothetical protein